MPGPHPCCHWKIAFSGGPSKRMETKRFSTTYYTNLVQKRVLKVTKYNICICMSNVVANIVILNEGVGRGGGVYTGLLHDA